MISITETTGTQIFGLFPSALQLQKPCSCYLPRGVSWPREPGVTLGINAKTRCYSSGPSKLSCEMASGDKPAGSLGWRGGEAEPEDLNAQWLGSQKSQMWAGDMV